MEPTPPELGANTGSPRELVFESREELLYLLSKNGVIVGKEWGGTGELTVQGALK